MLVFISYVTSQKGIGARARNVVRSLGFETFMAHEDIDVSRAWQREILRHLTEADAFIAILSREYLERPFCMQEAGIAMYLRETRGIPVIPLSIDETVSPGFMSEVQSVRIDPASLVIASALITQPLADRYPGPTIDGMISRLSSATSYRDAEARFGQLHPFRSKLTDAQGARLLRAAANNGQVYAAHDCAARYLPAVFVRFRHLIDPDDDQTLQEAIAAYS